jgi:hypothetical protein
MSKPVYDHVDEQFSFALLGPIRDQIRVLEDRTHHYIHHVRMSPESQEKVRRAHEVLINAREEVERLRSES